MSDSMRFDGRVAIITGSARGLGREYALLLASRGASIVVNDLGGDRHGGGKSLAADEVVQQIKSNGGIAIADYNSVEDGELIVKTAIDNFGRVDIVINNAGILRDKSILKLTNEDWDLVHRIHLRAAFIVTRAAWPYFRKQSYGRIIMTASPSGIYGNFGQSNYSSAKLGLLALSNTLSIEGSKYNIHCNTIVPVAASRLTEDLLPENLNNILKPIYVAPVVAWLCHESCTDTGGVYEAAGGFAGKYTWRRSLGKVFDTDANMTPELVRDSWSQITNMEDAKSPSNMQEHLNLLIDALTNNKNDISSKTIFKYTIDDVILYAIAVGVSTHQSDYMRFLYECSDRFAVLPTFATVVVLKAIMETSCLQNALKTFNIQPDVTKMVHGEHYLEMINPIPSSGTFVSETRVDEVLDKGSGALVVSSVDTFDQTGTHLFYNQLAIFMIDSGNFGGKRTSDNNLIKPIVAAPERNPDAIVFEQTTENQAALFRLCGDKNPLHIDPAFAAVGGFQNPILHGLCSLGYSFRHVLKQFADNDVNIFKRLKARFAGPIYPGQTIQTNMWKEGTRIHFQSYIKETQKLIITGAYVDFIDLPVNDNINSNHVTNDINFSKADNHNVNALLPNQSISNIPNVGFQNNINKDKLESQVINNTKLLENPILSNASNQSNATNTDVSELVSRTDKIFTTWLIDRIRENKELVPIIKTVYQWNITQNGKTISIWTLDLKNGDGNVYKGMPKSGKADCTLTIDDDYAVDVFEGKADAMKAFMTGKLKITGNILAAQKLQQLWAEEAPRGAVSLETQNETVPENGLQSSESDVILDDQALLDSIPTSGLKSDIVFTVFKNRMHEEPELVRRLRVIFQFNITKDGKTMAVWTADNKNKLEGDVYRSASKNGKPDCTITVEDDDFLKLMVGRLNPQRAFMMGKLKIKGNIMLLQKLNSMWIELQKVGKTPELPFFTDMMLAESVIPGLRSEAMIVELVQRLVRLPQLCKELPFVFGFDITKNGKSVSPWTLDFTKNKFTGIFFRGAPKDCEPVATFIMDDDDFVRLTYNTINLKSGIASQRIKVKGDVNTAYKLNILFTTPTSRAKL